MNGFLQTDTFYNKASKKSTQCSMLVSLGVFQERLWFTCLCWDDYDIRKPNNIGYFQVDWASGRTNLYVHYEVCTYLELEGMGPEMSFSTVYTQHYFTSAGCMELIPPSRGSIDNFQSAAEGATITYSCSSGLVPRTQISAVCTNMAWRPDPATLQCREPLPGELGRSIWSNATVSVFQEAMTEQGNFLQSFMETAC